ncbi:transmembrane protein 120 homolog isoform X2 [Sesamum indicum]|uniref:Transmembrane protein 120 homolog isoform X2 n=1 Tax=Sesamum indicum TaxID=4182 RepID=A0A8M8V557_SESIN|nr:transmembrane protein 120 homolog isoform X2 [Sesamum indicum]
MGEPSSLGGEVSSLVEQAKELQEKAASLISRTSREEEALRQRVASLDSRINSLRTSKHDDKDRTAFLFLFLPTLLLMLRSWIWDGCLPALPVQLYQAWLLYLYTGLALRENILRVNGSDIRPWWIKHHYFAMAMALISLTWEIERGPDCAQKQRGVELFLKWAIMQGVAMILQNRYQRQRLYTRIALGKARRMDVVWGETAGVQGQLLLLCPILFILQGFEAYVGVLLLKTALAGFSSDWQVITCGLLLIIMAVGNFVNTVQTLMTKSRVKAKIRKGKSRQELNQESGDKSL